MRSIANERIGFTLRPPRVRSKRPVWSARSFAAGAVGVAVVAGVVLLVGERSLLVKAEWVTTFASGVLWMFLFVGLYRGVRVRRNEPVPERTPIDVSSNIDSTGADGLFNNLDLGDDLVGGIIALILWILFGILLIFFLPLLLEGASYALFVLVGSLSWIFRRALRQVFVHGRRCRGRLGASITRASVFTLLYSGWLFALLVAARSVAR